MTIDRDGESSFQASGVPARFSDHVQARRTALADLRKE
ncbi:hypothetical protein J3R04_000203 [Spirilliplanes yamanashiensis]|nr:hypothetical protein [Spirilliplanes yamanashiensis]